MRLTLIQSLAHFSIPKFNEVIIGKKPPHSSLNQAAPGLSHITESDSSHRVAR